METKNKIIVSVALILLGLGTITIWQFKDLGRARLIACDIGQGDGMLIVSSGGKQVVIDAGPGTKIVDCLGKNMPFWDRKIEMIVSTHAQKDHMEGFLEIFKRYEVETVITTGIGNKNALFDAWLEAVKEEKTKVHNPVAGEKIVVDDLVFDVLWPPFAKASGGKPPEEWKINPPSDLNEASIVMRLSFKPKSGTCAYLTGDITKEILEDIVNRQCDILKVSHHGSKTGTSNRVLELANPKVAVIQVGKNNYGHPTQEVLGMLEKAKVRILRNDLDGEVEVDVTNEGLRIVTKD